MPFFQRGRRRDPFSFIPEQAQAPGNEKAGQDIMNNEDLAKLDEIARKIERLREMGIEYILLNGGGTSRENLRRFAASRAQDARCN